MEREDRGASRHLSATGQARFAGHFVLLLNLEGFRRRGVACGFIQERSKRPAEIPKVYSVRKACIGCTEAARRAGNTQAIMPVNSRTTPTAENAAKSMA